jgi:hypothetical protein
MMKPEEDIMAAITEENCSKIPGPSISGAWKISIMWARVSDLSVASQVDERISARRIAEIEKKLSRNHVFHRVFET